jgi:hypothetical protein
MSDLEPTMTKEEIVKWILSCRDHEAKEAKNDRMILNQANYRCFQLKHDFSHKKEGQSTEVLSKQSLAVEQIKSFFQQALADLGEWWKAEVCYPDMEQAMLVRPHEITKLTNYMLERAKYFSHVGNSIESALLGSLVISKTTGKLVSKPKFISRKKGRGKGLKRWVEKIDNKTWEIRFEVVRAENYYPDPTGADLYEIEDSFPDLHEVQCMADEDEDFDQELVKNLSTSVVMTAEDESKKAVEAGQNTSSSGHRPKVKLTEFWGDIIHPTSGRVVFENVQAIIANDKDLILAPRPNPLWHQKRPYTVSPLLEVANSVWHKALMDAPTKHSHALTEIYNLIVDAAMKQVHAVTQVRKDWLANPAQVSEGVKPGAALTANSVCPPGGKVMEPLTQVQIPAEAFNVYNIMAQELNSSSLTNDLRNGVMPFRAVKATEVVEASQTITSVFQGMAKNYESRQSLKELELAWETAAQNWDQIDKEVFISLFGAQRGTELFHLSPEDVFASTVNGIRFRVFGVTQTLQKAQDFQKLTTMLQTIAASPVLMEEYAKKYDFGKTLGEIMTALNIDKHKLEIPEAVQRTMQPQPDQGAPVQGQPDQMSQVPQAGGISAMAGPALPQTSFPGSPALIGGNQ